MSPPPRKLPPPAVDDAPPMSRRNFMVATTAALAASAVGVELATPAPAAAAVTWGYPFTATSGRSRGFSGANGHAGVDYTPGNLTPIHAVADGTIIISRVSGDDGAYGESIWIQHADGYRTIYGHMAPNTRVPVGPVKRGDFIGRVGTTGRSTGPHLHLELRRNDVPINPDPFIDSAPRAEASPQTPEPPEEHVPFFNHKQATAPLDFVANTTYFATFNGVLVTNPTMPGDTNLAGTPGGGAGLYSLDIPLYFTGLFEGAFVTVNLALQDITSGSLDNWYLERFEGNATGEVKVAHSAQLIVPSNKRLFLRITPTTNVRLEVWGRMVTNFQGVAG